MPSNTTPEDRPVGELVGDLASQTSALVRKELELAKVELTQKGKAAGAGAGMFGGAGISALYGLGALTACAILALAQAIEGWVAALVVAVVWFAIAGVLALAGKSKAQKATPPLPEQAIETTKDDVAVTKARVKEARS